MQSCILYSGQDTIAAAAIVNWIILTGLFLVRKYFLIDVDRYVGDIINVPPCGTPLNFPHPIRPGLY